MLFKFLANSFLWLPAPLHLLTTAVFSIFAVIILWEVIKIIIDIFKVLKDVFGGLISKVVDFFV